MKERLKSGESGQSINRDLKTLSREKFRNLLGRSNEAYDAKQNDADAHPQSASSIDSNEQSNRLSQDPNGILAPAGFGDEQFIAGENRLIGG